MPKLPPNVEEEIAQALERAGVHQVDYRSFMIEELSQLIQLRAWQIAALQLSETTRQQLRGLPESEIAQKLQQHVSKDVFQAAAAQAIHEIVPNYIQTISSVLK